jgi:2-hydroxychromene-2-carboxylate isomerase
MRKLEFWFEFASTYSYVAVEEIEDKANAAGVELVWRPFLLGPIFAQLGWRDSPFNLYPAKGSYMWRDVERLCELKRIAWRRPNVFPRNGLLAARVATALDAAEKLPAFVRSVYRANFSLDLDISEPSVLKEILRSLSLDEEATFGRANDDAVKRLLRERTDEAKSRGVFGAPSFFAKGELFWGSDRLEQALEALKD